MPDLAKKKKTQTFLNEAENKVILTAETAYRFVDSLISTQILLWEIKTMQQINKPDIFSSIYKAITILDSQTSGLAQAWEQNQLGVWTH